MTAGIAGLKPVDVIATGYGRPALQALVDRLATVKRSDPLAPATVIVSNNYVGVATRRAVASGAFGPVGSAGAGVAGVTFLTTYRLAELLGAPALAATGRRPVSTPVIAAAVRAALTNDPGVFAGVAEHPTTERRLVAAHRELSDVDDTGLDALAASGARARSVVRVHRQVRRALADDWYDEQDLVRSAIEILARDPGVLDEVGPIVVFLPDDIPAPRARLLVEVAARTPVAVIAGMTGSDDADETVRAGVARVAGHAGLAYTPPAHAASATIESRNTSDPDDEVRHVVRDILADADAGVAFDRMAVLYAADQPYARLLHDHLRSAGVPFNGAAVSGLAESVAGRTLLRLLRLADRGLRRDDLMTLISSLPFRWNGRTAPSRAWDQISREAGVVRGLPDWRSRLERYAADRAAESEALAADPDADWRAERLARDAARARDLLAFVESVHRDIAAGTGASGWSGFSRWAQQALARYLGDLHNWPAEELDAAERLDGVLERLAGLDTIEKAPTAAIFRRTLEMELDGGLGRVGRLGHGVLVGRAWTATGLTFDRLWVLGMAEGTYPSRPRDDSLLPDRERQLAGGQMALRGARLGDEHRHLLAAVAGTAADGIVRLSRPRGDLRASNERVPSRWLDGLAARTDDPSWDREVASFAHGLLRTPFPATEQELDLQIVTAHMHRTGTVAGLDLVGLDSDFAASVALQAGRSAPRFGRYDGLVGRELAPDLTVGGITSATALESWATCPHQYFVRHLLRVRALDTPEQRVRLDPLSKGVLVHRILERFVARRVDDPSGHGRWRSTDRDALLTIADEEFRRAEDLGLTGESIYWQRDQVLLRRDLERFLDEDNDRRAEGGLRPLRTELGFGTGDTAPATIAIGGGRTLQLRGSIDLVDIDAAGRLHVTDYKTGGAFAVKDSEPHANGTRLQLVLYSEAARQALSMPDAEVRSQYWFVSRRGNFRPSGYVVTDGIRREVLHAVTTIVDNIAAGRFPLHPDPTTRTAFVPCDYCDPDGLGVSTVRRRFEVLAHDPALEDYIALVEPDLLPPRRLLDGAT